MEAETFRVRVPSQSYGVPVPVPTMVINTEMLPLDAVPVPEKVSVPMQAAPSCETSLSVKDVSEFIVAELKATDNDPEPLPVAIAMLTFLSSTLLTVI